MCTNPTQSKIVTKTDRRIGVVSIGKFNVFSLILKKAHLENTYK